MKKQVLMPYRSSSSKMRGIPVLGPYAPIDMCSGRSAKAGSRWIHGLSPSRSNVIVTAHRAPFGHVIARSMTAPCSDENRLHGRTILSPGDKALDLSTRGQRGLSAPARTGQRRGRVGEGQGLTQLATFAQRDGQSPVEGVAGRGGVDGGHGQG